MNKTDTALRMRDAGRSWTDIAAEIQMPVSHAKALVGEAKKKRREDLAHSITAETARGLREECACGHYRKDHATTGPDGSGPDARSSAAEHDGPCHACGPVRTMWVDGLTGITYDQPDRPARPADRDPDDWFVWAHDTGCEAFRAPAPRRRWRRTEVAYPNRRRHSWGGRNYYADGPELPGPSERTQRRRARRRARLRARRNT